MVKRGKAQPIHTIQTSFIKTEIHDFIRHFPTMGHFGRIMKIRITDFGLTAGFRQRVKLRPIKLLKLRERIVVEFT